jgi:quercetin dioxygenase-like cupin family protein
MDHGNMTISATSSTAWTTHYQRWLAAEGVSVIKGFYLPDLGAVETAYWQRMGANVAFIELEGIDEGQGTYVCEVPPAHRTHVQKHLYEELVYVLEGAGITRVWGDDEADAATCEWQQGSIFALPLNCSYRHYNTQGDASARLLVVTTAPIVMNLFHDDGFVFDNPSRFDERFPDSGSSSYFDGSGKSWPGRLWQTNLVADARTFPLQAFPERGAGGRNVLLEVGEGSTLAAHISEFDVGTYKKAHRHGPGAHIIVLSGQGYSLMWPSEGADKQRYDWAPGAMLVPPERWFHQHFNSGAEPARYLALRWAGSRNFPLTRRRWGFAKSTEDGGDQIEYKNEDPRVRETFDKELSRVGVTSSMSEVLAEEESK